MVPSVETSYLARAGKNEFLNLVPDIEEMRPGWVLTWLFGVHVFISSMIFTPGNPTKQDVSVL